MSKRSSMKKVLAVSLVLALLLSGCSRGQELQVDAEPSLGTAVEVQQLKKSTIKNELTYIGQVQPQMSISVASKLSAEVLSVNFEVGDYVNAGDVLFTVDAKDINDQIRQLQASAAQTELAIQQAEYGLEIAQEGSKQERLTELQYESSIFNARFGSQTAGNGKDAAKDAREAYEMAAEGAYYSWQAEQAHLELLKDAKENGYMVDNQVVTEAMIEKQEKMVSSAQNQYYQADMSIDSAGTAYDNSKIAKNQADKAVEFAYDSYDAYKDLAEENKERSVKQAEFGVESAQVAQNATQVQLSIAQSNLGNTVVTSPISGIVSARNVEAGQLISPSVLPYTIVKMDVVNVDVSVSETLINSIQVGDEVQVVIPALGEEPLTGIVKIISPVAGANSTYPIQVELDNSHGLIKPGMFSQVSFVQAEKNNTFVVDKNVVMRDETSQYVYVVEDGAAKKVTVTTGLSNGEEIEILSGVKAGDQIVVVGQEYLDNNTAVNIVKKDGVDVREQLAQTQEEPEPQENSVNETDADLTEEDSFEEEESA